MIVYRITYRPDKPADWTVREWRNVLRRSWAAVGAWWHANVAKGHFRQEAHDKYGYQTRDPKYLASRRKKGKPDIFLSGQTYNAATGMAMIRGFPTRVRVEMPTPGYVQMRPMRSGRPNLGEEITRVIYGEVLQMETVLRDLLETEINRPQPGPTIDCEHAPATSVTGFFHKDEG